MRSKICSLEDKKHQGEENVIVKSTQPLRRFTRLTIMLARYRDRNSVSITSFFLASLFGYFDPSCFDEAQGVKKWKDAMDEEMRALQKKIKLEILFQNPRV